MTIQVAMMTQTSECASKDSRILCLFVLFFNRRFRFVFVAKVTLTPIEFLLLLSSCSFCLTQNHWSSSTLSRSTRRIWYTKNKKLRQKTTMIERKNRMLTSTAADTVRSGSVQWCRLWWWCDRWSPAAVCRSLCLRPTGLWSAGFFVPWVQLLRRPTATWA